MEIKIHKDDRAHFEETHPTIEMHDLQRVLEQSIYDVVYGNICK